MYVVETDATCKYCHESHNYVTKGCMTLTVFADYSTAAWVARAIEGSAVREINEVPDGVSYVMFMHKGGRPDPALPQTQHTLPRR